MTFDSLFFVALQSSFVLGIVHGINPCGHSWLVLAPFVVGEKSGRTVSFLTASFLAGTTMACMILGITLGAVSLILPGWIKLWVDIITVGALIVMGLILIIRPSLIHHHDHDHDHHHAHDDKPCSCVHGPGPSDRGRKLTGLAMFGIGFFNMIVPCPTAAVMYGYALDSQHTVKAFSVFTLYALSTAIAVSAVIFLIFKITAMVSTLSREGVESVLMRFAGVLTLFFAGFSLYTDKLI